MTDEDTPNDPQDAIDPRANVAARNWTIGSSSTAPATNRRRNPLRRCRPRQPALADRRRKELLEEADLVVHAGSLVNSELLDDTVPTPNW